MKLYVLLLLAGLLNSGFALEIGVWKNYTPDAVEMREADGMLVLRRTGSGKSSGDGMVAGKLSGYHPGRELEFSAFVRSEVSSAAYLQVRLYCNRREIRRIASSYSSRGGKRLSIRFIPGDADRIELGCRLVNTPFVCGSSAFFEQLRIMPVPVVGRKTRNLRFVPAFYSASVYLEGGAADDFTMSYREKGAGEWCEAPTPVVVDGMVTGVLFSLREGTAYEVELVSCRNPRERYSGTFRTRESRLPVARTIVLDAKNCKLPLIIRQSGSPDGYIRYTAAPGFVLDAGFDCEEAIRIDEADYIILDQLTVRGGRYYGINLLQSGHVVIRRCDISGFGAPGVRREGDGKYLLDNRIVYDLAGIRIKDSGELLIEHNLIHSPTARTCPWFDSHPDGPHGIFVQSPGAVTLRWNDLVGSDLQRWNDGIGGDNNDSPIGGFCRDAEIFGNFIYLPNDDGIELDGGQRNVRLIGNRIEGGLCGVSTAPAWSGPSYLVGNLLCDPGDQHGIANFAVKNAFRNFGPGQLRLFFNTVCGNINGYSNYSGIVPNREEAARLKGVMRNNLFAVKGQIFDGGVFRVRNDFDHDLLWNGRGAERTPILAGQERNAIRREPRFVSSGAGDYRLRNDSPGKHQASALPGFGAEGGADVGIPARDGNWFRRPTALAADAAHLRLEEGRGVILMLRNSSARPLKFQTALVAAPGFFSVSPAEGVVPPNGQLPVNFTVKPEAVRMARRYRGAVVFRDPDRIGVPVTVEADLSRDAVRAGEARRRAIAGSVSRQDGSGSCRLEFDVERPGCYYLFVFATERPVAVNLRHEEGKAPWRRAAFYGPVAAEGGAWYSLTPTGASFGNQRPFRLECGRHRFALRQRREFRYRLEAAVLTPEPESFLQTPFVR